MSRRQDEEKRKRILDAAYIIFGETGYRNTTMKEIAEKAGVAAGSIYTYFDDKEELFRSTVEEGWNRFIQEISETTAGMHTYREKMSALIEIGFEHLEESYPLLHGMFCEANRMQLFQTNMERLCLSILNIFGTGEVDRSVDRRCREQRNFFIKIVVSGLLFNTAVTPPDQLGNEIEKMKEGIATGFLHKKQPLVKKEAIM